MSDGTATKAARSSNIELLRIIAMLMIVNLHSFVAPEVAVSWADITGDYLFDFFREALCIPAVNIFIVISGYYSIRWKVKSFFSLVFQTYFFVLIIYFLTLFWGNTFNIKTFLLYLNCIPYTYWFIAAYVGLYLLSPLLNAFTDRCSAKQLLIFLIVYYLFQFYYQLMFSNYFNAGYSILSFFGLYLIGRYINKLHQDDQVKSYSAKSYFFIYLLASIALTLILLFMQSRGMNIKDDHIFGLAYNNPLVVVQSVALFLCFSKLKIQSKFINFCGSSVLAVYLVHMHPQIKYDYYMEYCSTLYALPYWKHLLVLSVLFVAIFVVSILADKVRLWIYNVLYEFLRKKCPERIKRAVVHVENIGTC